MDIRAVSLASMTNIEKSVKELVIENNLRLVGLLAPHQDVKESTAGSVTGGEVPEQHPDVSQPPRRRKTGMTIREPSITPRAAAAPAPPRKGKQKQTPLIIFPDCLYVSFPADMPVERAFDLYTNPACNKKSSRRRPGEGCSDPSAKRARTEDPPAPTPTKETTPPPTPVNQNPPAPVDQTPPAAPADITPPVSTDQTPSVFQKSSRRSPYKSSPRLSQG
ncbi:proline-rich receptor-like protein kinase PERK8 [Humulus lupulus]|uniref:proline-rich receptor-like protein kinase PERK8 n=1 Tax=Humulus lupulus TaxID=3486 RepID=UPI002B410433|nr:proline-rich receptor-like protein kinase PERK8 [Humulus lupulus]